MLHISQTVLAPKNSKVVAGVSGSHARCLPETLWRFDQILTINKPHEYFDHAGIIPELSATPSFTWHQAASYSSVDYYVLEVVDESGSTIWGGFDLAGQPKVTWPKEDPITIDYNFDFTATLATLEAGRYYQLRIYASKEDTSPLGFKLISSTETLDGVFKVETL